MLPPQRVFRTLLLCALAVSINRAATAQTFDIEGAEYRLGGALSGDQVYPSVRVGASGGYLIWQDSKLDRAGEGVAAVRLDANLQPAGLPFRVSRRTRGHQQKPQVATLTGGGAVFVWQSGQRGSNDVFARFVQPGGSFQTPDVQVNPVPRTVFTNYVMEYEGLKNNRMTVRRARVQDSTRLLRDRTVNPSVAALPDGGAVVAYTGHRRMNTNFNVIVSKVTYYKGRRYTNDVPKRTGTRLDWGQDVFVQRVTADGRKAGTEVVVNQFTKFNQRDAAVAALPGGGFVVTYISERNFLNLSQVEVRAGSGVNFSAQIDVNARLFDSNGQPMGDEFTVNTAARPCYTPVVSALADGRFTIAWAQRDGERQEGLDIYARMFEVHGAPTGPAVRVNSYTYGDQFAPRIASQGESQLIVWSSLGQDGSWEGVYAQGFSAGSPCGQELRVNSTAESRQFHPSVAPDGSSGFLVAWSGFDLETSFDIYGQRVICTGPELAFAPAGAAAAGAATTKIANLVAPSGAASLLALSKPNLGSDGEVSVPVVTLAGGKGRLSVHWNTQPGGAYRVQGSANLVTWRDLGPARVATGASDAIEIDTDGVAAFYRVLRLR